MKKRLIAIFAVLFMVLSITACGGTVEKKVTCTMCNGTGQVKYYYGDGDNDYNLGPCTSCDEKGYTIVEVDKADADKEICGSCMKPVDELITKEDAAGESRTWCKDCWADYDAMMGR